MEDLSFKFNTKDFINTRQCDALESWYTLRKLLGEGAYGCVYACTNLETGAERAVKVLEKCAGGAEKNKEVIDEYLLLKDLDHPNLIRCYELIEGTVLYCFSFLVTCVVTVPNNTYIAYCILSSLCRRRKLLPCHRTLRRG